MEVDQPDKLEGALSAPSAQAAGHAGQDGEGEGTADDAAGTMAASNGDKSKSKSKARDRTADKSKGKGKGKGKGRAKQADEDSELSILEKLALSPYSSELHAAHIAAAASDEEREEARAFMAQMVPLSEDLWLAWIRDRKAQVGGTLEGKVEVLELYKRACSDILCKLLFSCVVHENKPNRQFSPPCSNPASPGLYTFRLGYLFPSTRSHLPRRPPRGRNERPAGCCR